MAVKNKFVQVIFQAKSGAPEDIFVTTLTFIQDESAYADPNASLRDTIISWWNNVNTIYSSKMAQYIGNGVDRGANKAKMRIFDLVNLDGTPPSMNPAIDYDWTLGPEGVNPAGLPWQCAIALSYHGDLTGLSEKSAGTRPRQRRRGRIYLGPLIVAAIGYDPTDSTPTLTTTTRDFLAANMNWLHAAAPALPLQWSGWSRTNAEVYPIKGGFVNSNIDIIRRRQFRSENRSLWGTQY